MKLTSLKSASADPQTGFSLIELMVAISIMTILAYIAIPSFSSFVQSSSVDGVQVKFQQALLYARSEAIKRNAIVKICRKKQSEDQCDLPAASDWSNGWLVYVDAQDETDAVITGSSSQIAEKILKKSAAISAQASFVRSVSAGNTLRSTICFNGLGMVCNNNDQASTFTIDSIANGNDRYARRILVSIIGKISLESDKYQ